MELNVKIIDHYRKKGSGQITFRFLVSGADEALKKYKELQSERLHLHEGQPIFFSINPSIKRIILSFDGKRFVAGEDLQQAIETALLTEELVLREKAKLMAARAMRRNEE